MKTVKIDNKRHNVSFRTNTEMRTKASFNNKTFKQGLGCNVYNIEGCNDKVALILHSAQGELRNSITIISESQYEEIVDLYDPYAKGRYHTALLEQCGATNHLCLR